MQPKKRFQIEKLEERIAPSSCGGHHHRHESDDCGCGGNNNGDGNINIGIGNGNGGDNNGVLNGFAVVL